MVVRKTAPLFHRGHHNIIAAQINYTRNSYLAISWEADEVLSAIERKLATRFALDNPNFDEASFFEACRKEN